jgi:hypothetical protein
MLAPLADWNNFYVIVGSAAAGLTGLTFVVITLAAEASRVNVVGLRTFVTPTIVHFGTVLVLSAFLSVPRLSLTGLGIGFGIVGALGLIYVGVIAAGMSEVRKHYIPVREDWLWNVIMPAVVHGVLLAVALLLRRGVELGLYLVAAMTVLLLFVGIRNAWDVAVWTSMNKQSTKSQEPP